MFTLLIGPTSWLWGRICSRWTGTDGSAFTGTRNFTEAFEQLLVHIPLRSWGGFRVVLQDDLDFTPRHKTAAEVLGAVSLLNIVVGLPVAVLTASIVSVGLATSTIAISKSPNCCRYIFDTRGTNTSLKFLEFEHRSEAQSAAYADSCYSPASLDDDCNKFYNRSISYSIELTVSSRWAYLPRRTEHLIPASK